MKYFEVEFIITGPKRLLQDASDLMSVMALDAGFEAFEDTLEGVVGYVQQYMFDEKELKKVIRNFPLKDIHIEYTVKEADDEDWNEEWEREGFDPILVEGTLRDEESRQRKAILIHDGRHLPENLQKLVPPELTGLFFSIEIDTHMAFGTGNHETTRLVCSTLLDLDLRGKQTLDCGTGTGILSICALKLGAKKAMGYDIDEWSVDNALHNAVINGVASRLDLQLGNASILNKVRRKFDVVMANINRNILLEDMQHFLKRMNPGGNLIISGFFNEDCPMLLAEATRLGFRLKDKKVENNWACLMLTLDPGN